MKNLNNKKLLNSRISKKKMDFLILENCEILKLDKSLRQNIDQIKKIKIQ